MIEQLPKIFLVGNGSLCCQLLEHVVRNCGYQHVQVFPNATACLKALPDEPTIVLLDEALEDMPGTDVLKAIKRINSAVHVVLLSECLQLQLAANYLNCGAIDCVQKDERLTRRLTAILASIEHMRALRQSYRKLVSRPSPQIYLNQG